MLIRAWSAMSAISTAKDLSTDVLCVISTFILNASPCLSQLKHTKVIRMDHSLLRTAMQFLMKITFVARNQLEMLTSKYITARNVATLLISTVSWRRYKFDRSYINRFLVLSILNMLFLLELSGRQELGGRIIPGFRAWERDNAAFQPQTPSDLFSKKARWWTRSPLQRLWWNHPRWSVLRL